MSLTQPYFNLCGFLTFINEEKTRPADLVVEVIGERYSTTAPLIFLSFSHA